MAVETSEAPERRPQSRDAERTRAAILAAATEEFTAHGYGGASINDVAARAAINKRMIYHYFGSKEGLWLAVLEEAYAKIRSAESGLDLDHLDPLAALRSLVVFTFDYFVAHPEFISLLNTENMLKARHLKTSARVRQMHSPLVRSLGEVLQRGAAAGVVRGGVDPVQLYVSIASLSYFYLSNQHTLGAIFGRDLGSAPALEARREHVAEVIERFVEVTPA